MPHQKDYGTHDDTTLVPSTLTVFRHFQAWTDSMVLTPMGYKPTIAGRNFRNIPSHRHYMPSGIVWPGGEVTAETYHAECNKFTPDTLYSDGTVHGGIPNEKCSCGFYASYDPATDFYPSFYWGDSWCRARAPERVGMAIVKAAVEVSGRVVMGRLGVRAEKMKIVGLAIDWSKRVKVDSEASHWGQPVDFGYGRLAVWNEEMDSYEIRLVEPDGSDDDHKTIGKVAALATRYGATFYGNVQEMNEAHPKADIEALGVDTSPRPSPESVKVTRAATLDGRRARNYVRGYKSVMIIQDEVITQMAEYIKKAADGIQVYADALQHAPEETVKEKALRLKRERPAPPGSGIDRRRGRLR